MSPIDDKVIELARTALRFEYGGEHFFRHAAGMTRNASGKAMFLRLAAEETDRMEDMRRLFSAIIGQDMWQRFAAEEKANAHPSHVVAEMEAEVAKRGHSVVADDTQALRLAMELERRVIQLFKELVAHTNDHEVVKLAGKIIDGECFQYDNLQAQLDSVINTGMWLDKPEFRMDGKF
jgi:rubrerythrin